MDESRQQAQPSGMENEFKGSNSAHTVTEAETSEEAGKEGSGMNANDNIHDAVACNLTVENGTACKQADISKEYSEGTHVEGSSVSRNISLLEQQEIFQQSDETSCIAETNSSNLSTEVSNKANKTNSIKNVCEHSHMIKERHLDVFLDECGVASQVANDCEELVCHHLNTDAEKMGLHISSKDDFSQSVSTSSSQMTANATSATSTVIFQKDCENSVTVAPERDSNAKRLLNDCDAVKDVAQHGSLDFSHSINSNDKCTVMDESSFVSVCFEANGPEEAHFQTSSRIITSADGDLEGERSAEDNKVNLELMNYMSMHKIHTVISQDANDSVNIIDGSSAMEANKNTCVQVHTPVLSTLENLDKNVFKQFHDVSHDNSSRADHLEQTMKSENAVDDFSLLATVKAEELNQFPNGLKILPKLQSLQHQCEEQSALISRYLACIYVYHVCTTIL